MPSGLGTTAAGCSARVSLPRFRIHCSSRYRIGHPTTGSDKVYTAIEIQFRIGSGRCGARAVADDGTKAEKAETGDEDKSLEMMRKFSEQYAKTSGTYFCVDKSVTSVVIKGLAEHKDSLGAPLCPCRHYDDKAAEAKMGYWNCPCTPMRERHECHCMLFLTEDNDFAGDDQSITIDEIKDSTASM